MRGEAPRAFPRETAIGSLLPLHFACGSAPLPAGKHRVRSCFRRSNQSRATARSGRPRSASWRSKKLERICRIMSELAGDRRFSRLELRAAQRLSAHAAELRGGSARILAYFSPPGTRTAGAGRASICWRCANGSRTSTTGSRSPRRSAANWHRCAALFRYLSREHRISAIRRGCCVCRKCRRRCREVPNAEVTNALVDGAGRDGSGTALSEARSSAA